MGLAGISLHRQELEWPLEAETTRRRKSARDRNEGKVGSAMTVFRENRKGHRDHGGIKFEVRREQASESGSNLVHSESVLVFSTVNIIPDTELTQNLLKIDNAVSSTL
jgi:hypothetical protein